MSRGKRVDSGAAGGARGDRGAPGLLRERIRQLERPTLPEVAGDAMRLSPSTERQFGRAREIGGRARLDVWADYRRWISERSWSRGAVRIQRSSGHPQPSSPGGLLCLGFLRADFGSMGLEAGTRPTRSRAIAFISLPRLNPFFLRGKHPLHQGSQHLRSERFGEKDGASWSGRMHPGQVRGISARGDHAQGRAHAQHPNRQLRRWQPGHRTIENRDRKAGGVGLHSRPSLFRAVRGFDGVAQPRQIHAHHLQQCRFVVDEEQSSRSSRHSSSCMIAVCDFTPNI